MRNRAKCKLCGDLLESFHQHDYVSCKCGEISIDGGQYTFGASCRDKSFSTFLRVDDDDKEIPVQYQDKMIEAPEQSEKPRIISKEEKLRILDQMIESYENLPQSAMTLPINHYDFVSLLVLIKSLFTEDK